MSDYPNYKVEKKVWGHIYHPCQEEIPEDMPEPVESLSCTGINHLLNKTPSDWFSKRQNTVETATYGSEFVASRTAVDQIVDLHYTLCILGVPLPGPSWLFGDNLSVVNSATMPSGKLLKRQNILNFHSVREA
eukprot:7398538-Ditylum_brightwellii.AAC.1